MLSYQLAYKPLEFPFLSLQYLHRHVWMLLDKFCGYSVKTFLINLCKGKLILFDDLFNAAFVTLEDFSKECLG